MKSSSTIVITTAFLFTVSAGPLAYGACQAGCAGIVMACYSAAGYIWGATAGATAPASIIDCNAAFGKCSADETFSETLPCHQE
ncbi:zygote-specific protein [Fusarium langsethiae]|uniref:Zygote-specific protein n=1 Tax=Fusarium langsethiae TaxID=179993 RepID=A0A0M9EPP4_FUSLA|nr:zygote-specific protein [Fusarium langsethiae]